MLPHRPHPRLLPHLGDTDARRTRAVGTIRPCPAHDARGDRKLRLAFREDFFLKPYIHEYFLGQIFGPHTDYVKQTFIEPTDTWEVYRMRPEFDTQRKVEAYFAGKRTNDSIWIRDGLYALSAMCCSCPTATIRTNTIRASACSTTTSTAH